MVVLIWFDFCSFIYGAAEAIAVFSPKQYNLKRALRVELKCDFLRDTRTSYSDIKIAYVLDFC